MVDDREANPYSTAQPGVSITLKEWGHYTKKGVMAAF